MLPTIVQEISKASAESLTELRSEIVDVRYGKPGEILFNFRDNIYTTPEPMDVMPVGYGEASQSWALKQLLSKNAKLT